MYAVQERSPAYFPLVEYVVFKKTTGGRGGFGVAPHRRKLTGEAIAAQEKTQKGPSWVKAEGGKKERKKKIPHQG